MAATIDVPVEAKRRFRVSRNPLIAAAIALVIAVAGIAWLLSPRTAESTDNAYLKADSSSVAPKVGGLVSAVLVRDNQPVRAGDPLVQIDAQEFDAKLAAARAAVADADAGVATARAALAGLTADEGLAAAQVRAAQTSIQSADAEYGRASADRDRFETLVAQGFVTRRDVERVRATAVGAASARDRVRADRDVTSEQAAVTHARGPVLLAQLAQAEAAAVRARAALDLARQDQGHTIIRAPVDGVVGNRQVQTGDYVQPGSRLLTLVPSQALYVVANFKETQTRAMIPGQVAAIKVDALDGDTLTGKVESFAPGSGSEFTLLPFEPGSGNFTKIVQRVPVRIRLDPGQAAVARLRPGLSVTAKVSLR
ncbi:HlyD family secretion protein [Sphingomonas sp. QA11]|uniref:HlyD family secretion protein n=1 Tax=Sphingomonas sp. QA11 TaxID=2950605 RepID=UPI00234974BD|nr:HlyD family secretion protein [Sphingomonas sp. QA11]WCM27723.1 HlyD family secretion protein [Sphingomonas sp. QA11]